MATKDNHTLLTETPSPNKTILTDALSETQSASDKEFDIDEFIRELYEAPNDDTMVQECRKRLNEAKDSSVPSSEKEQMYRDIHRKFWAYVQSLPNREWTKNPRKFTEADQAEKKFRENKGSPIQWISYEGSMIICSLISVSDDGNAFINMCQLPKEDQDIILHMTEQKILSGFHVKLDSYKNFDCYIGKNVDKESILAKFTLGNRVASIPPYEVSRFSNVDVKVERKGKDILIGDRIKIDRNKMQNFVNSTDSTNKRENRGQEVVPRQKVSGRNAYEIRADILEMAIDWAKLQGEKKLEDVLSIAETFYSFVEHK